MEISIDNKQSVIEAIEDGGFFFSRVSDRLKADKDVVLVAVKNKAYAIIHATGLQNNKEIVLEAVKKYGLAIDYASSDLKNDKDIVREAVSNNPSALFYASERLQNDMEILRIAKKKSETQEIKFMFKNFFLQKMEKLQELEILEDEAWMQENNPQASSKHKARKF